MYIINLTELQFKNYSCVHSKRNYKQTIEYSNMMNSYGYDKLFLGLVDDNNNVIGACLILQKKLYDRYYFGYAPNGFLLDFDNSLLLKNFTKYLKEYLKELNFIYLRLNPNFASKIYGKNNIVLKCYPNIIDNMIELGYIKKGFNSKFKKYDAILHIDDINKSYDNLNRTTKRKLLENELLNLKIYKDNDIDKFYNIVIKKNTKNIDYYRNMKNYFNNDDIKFEIYFASLDTKKYLDNCRNTLYKEKDINSNYQDMIRDNSIKKTNKLIDDKIKSDKIINKYKNKVINASKIYSEFNDKVDVATIALIKQKDTIYFIEEGYEERLRNIYSLSILKWELIKMFYDEGYRNFNLGFIPLDIKENNKYKGIYLSKIGFNPKIYEYSGNYDLVINKLLYNILSKLKLIK